VTPNVATTTAFLNATKDKDLSQAPLAESVSYQGPLSGEPIRGRDHVSRFLGVYLPVINNIGLVRQIAGGDYVATVWQAETSFGPISLVYVFSRRGWKDRRDPGILRSRGFLERMGMWAGA
jgi:hypothetical protein